MQEIHLLNTFQSDYNKVELMKLSFEMYKWHFQNEISRNTVEGIYKQLCAEIWGEKVSDIEDVFIIDSFPNVNIAPIYCISTHKENGHILTNYKSACN
jgi:hypothetical protein